MKRIILRYWYILPILLALFMVSLIYLFLSDPSVIETVVGILLLLTLIMLPVSWVILFVNKQRWKFFASLGGSLVIVCVLWIPLEIASMNSPDGFGKEHPIPDGLKYNLPLTEDSCSIEPVDSLDPNTYLTIWNSFQRGIYTYDFYYGPLSSGEIYLKCFEVTENLPLSEERIAESSKVLINSTSSFEKLVSRQEFTIYEGDWGDYYAARIEVWYRDSVTKEERKLLEKVYRVEGWMR